MKTREPINLDRFASRITILTDVPFAHTSRTIKAMLILMAEMERKDVLLLLGRYRKFRGNVPYDLDKVHE